MPVGFLGDRWRHRGIFEAGRQDSDSRQGIADYEGTPVSRFGPVCVLPVCLSVLVSWSLVLCPLAASAFLFCASCSLAPSGPGSRRTIKLALGTRHRHGLCVWILSFSCVCLDFGVTYSRAISSCSARPQRVVCLLSDMKKYSWLSGDNSGGGTRRSAA